MPESKKNEINSNYLENELEFLEKLKDSATELDRSNDRGIINEENGSSVSIKENGNIAIAADAMAQYKISKQEQSTTEISMQSNTITNRKNILTDEITVNDHKLNPQLYELSDMRVLLGNNQKAIGDLTVNGTALIKTWEPQLGKWVLIRRQVRTPIFYQEMNLPDAPDQMSLNSDVDLTLGIEDDLGVALHENAFGINEEFSTLETCGDSEPVDVGENIKSSQVNTPTSNNSINQSIIDNSSGSNGESSSVAPNNVSSGGDQNITKYSLKKDKDLSLSKNFKVSDFKCKDGKDDEVIISGLLIEKLQELRNTINKNITITSAYRNPTYNKKIGGASGSQHTKGTAVDIVVQGMTPTEVRNAAKQVGFTGIGTYISFTHVDVRIAATEWRG